jgi:hypothetical protein
MGMKKFRVMCLKDAYVEYTTEVEADDAAQARNIARDYKYEGKWEREGVREYDETIYPLDEVEEIK